MIVPARVFGQSAPSNMIQVAQIGCGRHRARDPELRGILKHSDKARFVAVCDLDTVRMADAKQLIEDDYAEEVRQRQVRQPQDLRELPRDAAGQEHRRRLHQHARPLARAAGHRGRDRRQRHLPAEARVADDHAKAGRWPMPSRRTGRIFQMGSQQRSEPNFRLACELVRNGRIGKVQEVFIGLPDDPPGGEQARRCRSRRISTTTCGSARRPMVYYTEDRVHPQTASTCEQRYGRPGWLRCEQFGAGMITGWGAHHIDIAHWGMGTEHDRPGRAGGRREVRRRAACGTFMARITCRAQYANGTMMYISDKYPERHQVPRRERLDLGDARPVQRRRHASRQRGRRRPAAADRGRSVWTPATGAGSRKAPRTTRSICTPARITTTISTG